MHRRREERFNAVHLNTILSIYVDTFSCPIRYWDVKSLSTFAAKVARVISWASQIVTPQVNK